MRIMMEGYSHITIDNLTFADVPDKNCIAFPQFLKIRIYCFFSYSYEDLASLLCIVL